MRTTISLDDRLLQRAREVAARTGRSLSAVVEEALRDSLARRPGPERDYSLRLVTHRGAGTQPGVDLRSNESLRDLMDGR